MNIYKEGEQMWGFQRAQTSDGYISSREIDQETIDNAITFMDTILPYLDAHDITLVEDSEQGVIMVDIGEITLTYNESDRSKAALLHNMYLVGYLAKS